MYFDVNKTFGLFFYPEVFFIVYLEGGVSNLKDHA